MISHNRPIAELLRPQFKDISGLYKGEFVNMTEKNLTQKELEDARQKLIEVINASLTDQERQFLMSFKSRLPQWDLLELEGIEQLPAVRWKMRNLAKMSDEKHAEAYRKLKQVLEL